MHYHLTVARCREKGVTFDRQIREIDKTPEAALHIYDRMRACKLQTGWETPLTLEQLLGPDTVVWQIDDVGVMILAFTGPFGHVHVFFWDRRLRGREKMCRLHAQQVMRQYKLPELWTFIPQGMDVIAAFARRIGFKLQRIESGRMIFRVTAHELHDAVNKE